MYMKYFLVILSSLVIFTQQASAQAGIGNSSDIKKLIAKVKEAPPSERRVLMNALKLQLKSMQQENRTNVMLELRRAFVKNSNMPQAQQQISSTMHQQNSLTMSESKHMKESLYRSKKSNMKSPRPNRTPMKGK